MGDEEGRKRRWRIRLQGAAIAPGTSKGVQKRALSVLDQMTYEDSPTDYTDGKGGRCEGLIGRLTGWFKWKPGHQERRERDGEYRIVLKAEVDPRDDVKFITVNSIGARDNVYDNRYAMTGRKKR